jgi:hypothetical protein
MTLRTVLRLSLCLAAPLLTVGVARAQLQGASGFTTISDYPALATRVQPEQLAAIRTVARNVVLTASTSSAVLVEVVGHADFDSRGRAFEMAVSVDRAKNAAAILLADIQTELALQQQPTYVRDRITVTQAASGTNFALFRRPKNEQERRANRRVDFVHTITP